MVKLTEVEGRLGEDGFVQSVTADFWDFFDLRCFPDRAYLIFSLFSKNLLDQIEKILPYPVEELPFFVDGV